MRAMPLTSDNGKEQGMARFGKRLFQGKVFPFSLYPKSLHLCIFKNWFYPSNENERFQLVNSKLFRFNS